MPAQRPLSPPISLPRIVARSVGLHPWLFRKRIEQIDRKAAAGDLVQVVEGDGHPMGFGLFNPNSEIPVRMMSRGDDPPREEFWKERLAAAVALRKEFLKLDEVTDAYRVVHAEGDGLSGLMIDRFGDVLSAEAFGLGIWERGVALLEMLGPLMGTKHWILQTGPATTAQEGFSADAIKSPELPQRVTIQEFGTRFRVDMTDGHKTGFFCDQRDNRRLLANYCKGKTVLDLCCYTGGFAIQAKKLGEAADVTAVDIDEAPLQLAKENANLNQVRVKFAQADVFAYMRDMLAARRTFDVVVLDPPKLIRNRDEIEIGTRKHFDLNRLAMQLVAPGGLMLTCTCAGLLPKDEFVRLLHSAARQAGPEIPGTATAPGGHNRHAYREMQILQHTGAASDHPIHTHFPEGEYLQAVWMRLA